MLFYIIYTSILCYISYILFSSPSNFKFLYIDIYMRSGQQSSISFFDLRLSGIEFDELNSELVFWPYLAFPMFFLYLLLNLLNCNLLIFLLISSWISASSRYLYIFAESFNTSLYFLVRLIVNIRRETLQSEEIAGPQTRIKRYAK